MVSDNMGSCPGAVSGIQEAILYHILHAGSLVRIKGELLLLLLLSHFSLVQLCATP